MDERARVPSRTRNRLGQCPVEITYVGLYIDPHREICLYTPFSPHVFHGQGVGTILAIWSDPPKFSESTHSTGPSTPRPMGSRQALPDNNWVSTGIINLEDQLRCRDCSGYIDCYDISDIIFSFIRGNVECFVGNPPHCDGGLSGDYVDIG